MYCSLLLLLLAFLTPFYIFASLQNVCINSFVTENSSSNMRRRHWKYTVLTTSTACSIIYTTYVLNIPADYVFVQLKFKMSINYLHIQLIIMSHLSSMMVSIITIMLEILIFKLHYVRGHLLEIVLVCVSCQYYFRM